VSDAHRTRVAYDTVAISYADLLHGEFARHPLDLAVLDAFADRVPTGPVADIGCGPGHITAHLRERGLPVFGLDLSTGMLGVARRDHPDLALLQGSLEALPLADGSLAGLLAWYSVIHTPPERLSGVVGEFARVLADGGVLLLAFQVGDERIALERAYGHAVAMDVYRNLPEQFVGLLGAAGLSLVARLERAPELRDKTPQAFLLARKPTG
jgi:SAM-dependent methyltransferase